MKRPGKARLPRRARVAFQGELGAFSQQAARRIFGPHLQPLPCLAFEDVFRRLVRRKADFAVIPIENSLAGSIHQNFDLLAKHSLESIGETYVRIEHHLIANPRARMADIRQVYSHPVALAQCRTFLGSLRAAEEVSFYDTAGSVKFIRDKHLSNAAAVASADAARMYGMKILKRNIEDDRENYTRFLALARRGRVPHGGAKTSLVFSLRNEPGALFKALSVFALRDINLTKIESRPIRGRRWEYLFYVDLQSDIRSRQCVNALRHLQEMTAYFK
ncbi:MAG: prephenate dehydratase, partial [Acidobacteria bacterium]|nr:prephenate dehydratase [Acidobacteriota bacterium]